MSGKRKRKLETTISAAHEEKKPTCQEIDLSVDIGTKDKNSLNDPIESSETIKFVNCTYCKGKIASLKNFKDVINHTLLCDAPFVPVKYGYIRNKIITFSYENDTPLFRWTYKKDFNPKRKVPRSFTFYECLECRNSNQFQSHHEYEHLIEHQKDAHDIEYSSEFLSKKKMKAPQKVILKVKTQEIILNSEDKNDCAEYVEKTSQIQTLEITKTKLETELASVKKALEESKIDCVEKTNKIQALRFAKAKFETEVASTQKALEEKKVECIEKNSKIQTLEISEIKLKTEITSAQKALEESKAEAKVELEKVEHQLQTEVASKKSLEESNTKYRKLRQDWAVKVYQSDPRNEDLDNLLSLEPEKLFKKYEQIMKFNDSNVVKVEGEIDDTMKGKKLNLQIQQRELYEKEVDGIMDVLKMPSEDRVYTNILPMIKNLLEQVDTEHYTNAVENLIN